MNSDGVRNIVSDGDGVRDDGSDVISVHNDAVNVDSNTWEYPWQAAVHVIPGDGNIRRRSR